MLPYSGLREKNLNFTTLINGKPVCPTGFVADDEGTRVCIVSKARDSVLPASGTRVSQPYGRRMSRQIRLDLDTVRTARRAELKVRRSAHDMQLLRGSRRANADPAIRSDDHAQLVTAGVELHRTNIALRVGDISC